MNDYLQYVKLPDYFTHLLKINMYSDMSPFNNMPLYISKYAAFHGIVKNNFSDITKSGDIESIFKVLGWGGFRDRIGAIFINKVYHNNFYYTQELLEVSELIKFEDYITSFTVSGYSRGFLYAFYKKMSHQEIDYQVVDLLNYVEAKSVKIDWPLIILELMSKLWGVKVVQSYLEEKTSFSDMIKNCFDHEREWLVKNLLIYGNSIDEPSFFFDDLV